MMILPTMRPILKRRASGAILVGVGAAETTVVKPAGLAVGDLMFILVDHYGSGPSKSGWTDNHVGWSGGYGYVTSLFSKFLVQSDIDNAITIPSPSSQGVQTVAYRGVSSWALSTYEDGSTTSSQSTLNFSRPGRATNSLGQVAFLVDRDVTGDHQPPAGWVKRGQVAPQFFSASIHDRIDGSQPVPSGTDTFTGFTSAYPQVGFLIELRGA